MPAWISAPRVGFPSRDDLEVVDEGGIVPSVHMIDDVARLAVTPQFGKLFLCRTMEAYGQNPRP